MGKRANHPSTDYLIELIRAALLHTPLPAMPAACTPEEMAPLIRAQHLTNLVYEVVAGEPELGKLRALLEREYLVQIPKITNQTCEINSFLEAAEKAGVDCIPLKGYLLRQLYPSPLMRSMTDLDVLVRDMDRSAVKPWMESLGYEAEPVKELSIHENYKKKPWMYMELHRNLMKPCPGRDEFEKNIWERATLMPGKKHIYQMSMEDYYIFHIHHLYRHFVKRGAGLRGVIDIYIFKEACGKELDAGYLEKKLKALDIYDFSIYMEKLAYILLGDLEADEDSKLVADFMAGCGIFGTSRHSHTMRIAESGGSRTASTFKYRMKVLFPGVEGMRRHFPSVKKYPFLLPFYWIARIFKAVFSRKKKISLLKYDYISDKTYHDTNRVLTVTGTKKH